MHRDQVMLRARYAWTNSEHPGLTRLRRWWDGDLPGRFPQVVSELPGHPLVLGYAGIGDGLRHVLPFLEGRRSGDADAVRRRHSTLRWAQLERGEGLPDCDLLAVGTTAGRAPRLPRDRSLLLPFRLHLVVPIVADAEEMRRRISRKERQRSERQFRTRGWTVETSTSVADFDHFYDAIHLPTMSRRHGTATRSMDRDMARECLLRQGVLLFLREGDRYVAGMLCRYGPGADTLTLRLAGVLDGAEEHYAHGALSALYPALIDWAGRHGVRRLDLSGCEPFVSKGIFQFKRKFHPLVELPRTHFRDKRLWLSVRRDTPAVRDFLVANPVLAEDPAAPGRWHALYFHDAERPARRTLPWQCPNVTDTRDIDLDAFLGSARRTSTSHELRGSR
ncbi:GNAT family N-acetyltransferase [Streptomyces lavendulae]|uniref:GNAT family N-acetyltransferase n=1 Tax=Streptomyces lavendulae TaxID=1914 RepID=UPI00382F1C23